MSDDPCTIESVVPIVTSPGSPRIHCLGIAVVLGQMTGPSLGLFLVRCALVHTNAHLTRNSPIRRVGDAFVTHFLSLEPGTQTRHS